MFTGADGSDYTLVGFKDISGQTFASAWPETTTLYTTLFAGHVAEGASGQAVASGVLHIRPEDFLLPAVVLVPCAGADAGGSHPGTRPVRGDVPRQVVGRLRPPGGAHLS